MYAAWVQPKHHLQALEMEAKGLEDHIERMQDEELKQKWLKELRLNFHNQEKIKEFINSKRYQ